MNSNISRPVIISDPIEKQLTITAIMSRLDKGIKTRLKP
jgi:hypothetical protein